MGVISNLMYAVGFKINSGPINDAEKKIGGLTKGVTSLGAVAASVGLAAAAAIGGIGIAAVNSANDFERAMSKIQQSTGATTGMMEETRSIAKELYIQNLGNDWNDLAAAIANVQQVTKKTGSALRLATSEALILRDALGLEVERSVDVAQNAVENFGISTTQAFNLIAQGKQSGLDASGDLLDTIGEYSVYFKTLGFEANEMFDTLAAGASGGARNVDLVADAVKEFGIMAKDNSESTVKGFKMLGLNADQMMNTFAAGGPEAKKSFETVVQMISDIESPLERNQVGIALFGTKFEDLESAIIGAMGTAKSQFDMTKDTMEEIRKVKFTSIGDAMKMFGRQVETGFLIPLGQKMLPYLDRFGQWLTDNQPEIQKYGELIADKFGAGIAIAANEVKYFLNNFEKFKPYILAALGPIGAAISIFTSLFNGEMGEMASGANDTWVKVKTFFDSFMEKVNIVMPYIMTAIGIAMPIIQTTFRTALTYIWTTVKFVFDFLVVAITGAMEMASAIFSLAWNNITGVLTVFKALITGDFAGAWEAFKTTISGALDGVGKIFDTFVENAKAVGVNLIDGIISGVKTMIPAITDQMKAIGKGMLSTITDFFLIKSPSRVMMDIGGNVGKGMAIGIEHTGGMVNQASKGLAEKAITPYQDAEPTALAPATAAAVTNNTTSTQANPIHAPITVNVHVTGGNAADKQTGDDLGVQIASHVRQAVKDIIDSASRRMGVEGSPG